MNVDLLEPAIAAATRLAWGGLCMQSWSEARRLTCNFHVESEEHFKAAA